MNQKTYVLADFQRLLHDTSNNSSFQIMKTALDLNRLNFLNNDRIGSIMSLISHKGRLAPEVCTERPVAAHRLNEVTGLLLCIPTKPVKDPVSFEKGGFGEVLTKIVTTPFDFYLSATGYHWLTVEYVLVHSTGFLTNLISCLYVSSESDAIFFIGRFSCGIVTSGR